MHDQHLAIVPAAAQAGAQNLGAGSIAQHEKQPKKAVKTRLLDPVGPNLCLAQARLSAPNVASVSHLQPVFVSSLELLPTCAYPHVPASSIPTKFVTSSFFRHRAAINHLVYTPDGRRLLCGGNNGNVSLWNGSNFENELGPGIQTHEASPIRCMVFSRSGLYLLSCDDMGRVKFSKPTLEVLQVYHAHKDPCRSVTFAPTDFKFATGSDDSTVRVFDTFRGQELSMTGHGGDVRWVDWHPSKGVIASCSKDACIKLWDPRVGACLATLHGHKNGIFQAKWGPNGHWLLSCSRDQLVKLYDVRMLREVASFAGHGRDVTCCAWHPQHEELFVSGAVDGSLLSWLASRPDPQGALPAAHEAAVWSVAWHPLGHVLASAGADQKCQFWCRKRPGDIFQDVYGGQTDAPGGATAAAAIPGAAVGGLYGGGDGSSASASAAGLLGAGGLLLGGAGAAAQPALAPGMGGSAAAGGAHAGSRPHMVPGLGAVLDQLATANLQGLMTAPGLDATSGRGMESAAAGAGGAKRGREEGPRGYGLRDRDRERERDPGWARAKFPRMEGERGEGGRGAAGGAPPLYQVGAARGGYPAGPGGPGGPGAGPRAEGPPPGMRHDPHRGPPLPRGYEGGGRYDGGGGGWEPPPPAADGGGRGVGPGQPPSGYHRGGPPPSQRPMQERGRPPPPPHGPRYPPPQHEAGGPPKPYGHHEPHGYDSRGGGGDGGGPPPRMDPRPSPGGPATMRPYSGHHPPPPEYGGGPHHPAPAHESYPPPHPRHGPPGGLEGPYGAGPGAPVRGGPPHHVPGFPGYGRGRGRGRGPPPGRHESR